MRTSRAAAPAALPSIIATGLPAAQPNGHSNGHNGHNGHAAYAPQAPAPYSPMPRPAEDGMSPVLPPRVSARMYAQQPKVSWWRSWPLIVIVLAALAIVTAVILMVWPPGKPAAADTGELKDNKALSPGTGPDRMETNPLPPTQPPPNQPPAKSGDPWGGNGNNGSIDIPDDPSGPTGSTGNNKAKLAGIEAVKMEIPIHLCDRAVACNKNDPDLKAYCDLTKTLIGNFDLQPPMACTARRRCLEHIDNLDCDGGDIEIDMTSVKSFANKLQDCIAATTNC